MAGKLNSSLKAECRIGLLVEEPQTPFLFAPRKKAGGETIILFLFRIWRKHHPYTTPFRTTRLEKSKKKKNYVKDVVKKGDLSGVLHHRRFFFLFVSFVTRFVAHQPRTVPAKFCRNIHRHISPPRSCPVFSHSLTLRSFIMIEEIVEPDCQTLRTHATNQQRSRTLAPQKLLDSANIPRDTLPYVSSLIPPYPDCLFFYPFRCYFAGVYILSHPLSRVLAHFNFSLLATRDAFGLS